MCWSCLFFLQKNLPFALIFSSHTFPNAFSPPAFSGMPAKMDPPWSAAVGCPIFFVLWNGFIMHMNASSGWDLRRDVWPFSAPYIHKNDHIYIWMHRVSCGETDLSHLRTNHASATSAAIFEGPQVRFGSETVTSHIKNESCAWDLRCDMSNVAPEVPQKPHLRFSNLTAATFRLNESWEWDLRCDNSNVAPEPHLRFSNLTAATFHLTHLHIQVAPQICEFWPSWIP